uniref:Uncharacterized protein n=1 Tax=Oryza sativa subsp. japonica TaxID=39947 RepID=Q6Z6Q3_ORYSJ|nr:hypothetical protein [Oryza sativa Japonica Group]
MASGGARSTPQGARAVAATWRQQASGVPDVAAAVAWPGRDTATAAAACSHRLARARAGAGPPWRRRCSISSSSTSSYTWMEMYSPMAMLQASVTRPASPDRRTHHGTQPLGVHAAAVVGGFLFLLGLRHDELGVAIDGSHACAC